MAFPNINFNKAKLDAFAAIRQWGVRSQFTLQGGAIFTIRTTRAVPAARGSVQDMTAGMQQYDLKMLVPYDDWHAAAGAARPPQKGDRVTVSDRNHAIETVISVEAGDVMFGYELRIRG
jgi:hypothetical protein